MKRMLSLMLLFAMLWPAVSSAQEWDREKFPDYNPNGYSPEPSLVKYVRANGPRKVKGKAAASELPDHVNNAETIYFPPVISQDGGSCGSASRIYYMFTHELNSYRGLDASTVDNQYPTHFVWLLTYGNSSKDDFVTSVGVPSAKVYGGRTYSSIYGNYDWTDDCFGWMQGYDKWYSGFFNRMTTPTQNPYNLGTEEGRLAAKAWLYNHAGDTSFKAGGLIGLGVASGGNWQRIGKTANNDAIGVTGKYYVKAWGQSVDHALTMVGYDDRIEFDLDGNGVYGEESKDEKGAWIIANSWGGWCNDGFIYCPYAHAGPTFSKEGKLNGGFWTGELYHTRKDYRPLRTIKLKMDYTRRSELKLQAGISGDITATQPERTIDMHHFIYAGDGHNGNTQPAPEVPMLGKWANGKMHNEPMEFGYDLTDLTSGYDRNQPLKYFFIVNTRSWGEGEGHIYEASIMDYEYDSEGIETAFEMPLDGQVEIHSAGEKTIISVVVHGAAYNAPQNLAANEGILTWTDPTPSGHTLQGFVIYHNGIKLVTTAATTHSYALTESGDYALTAIYEGGIESTKVQLATKVERQETNQVINLQHGGFSIPGIFDSHFEECTIEYYIKPNSLTNYNNSFGPGWGSFLCHCNSDGSMSVGWNTGGHRIDNSSSRLAKGIWTHVAIVVQGNRMTLYMGASSVGVVSSNSFRGLGGFGDLVFSSASSNNFYNDASYDEIRIWNRARTGTEISKSHNREFYGDVMPNGLIAYYKGDVIEQDGLTYLRDCVGGHHALLTNENYVLEEPIPRPQLLRPSATNATLSIVQPEVTVRAGVPVSLSAMRGDAIRSLAWNIPGLGISDWHIAEPTVVFPEAGTYEVSVTGTNYEATPGEVTATATITVEAEQKPDATFTTTSTEIASGDRISFSVKNPMEGYSYRWSMPGADLETSGMPTVTTTYQGPGTYTVTLTATAPSGKRDEKTEQITVSEVAPLADFTLSDAIVLKGETVRLTDLSKHSPIDLQWTLATPLQNTVINNARQYDFVTEEPGIYDVSLKATNNKGTDTKTQERALVVLNADSENGLTFTPNTAQVVLPQYVLGTSDIKTFTIEWWMNPIKLTTFCLGMGDKSSTFMLCADYNGAMYFHSGMHVAGSGNGYVIPGQWHHYAVVYARGGTVRFYRDGLLMSSTPNMGSSISSFSNFTIGMSDVQMTGSIDEFRIWGTALPEDFLRSVCNQPLEDPDAYVTGEYANRKLLLYYPFNQSGGDVEDATSNGNHGTRIGFGPEGDAWGLSKGVFCLNFGSKKDDMVIDDIEQLDDDIVTGNSTNPYCYDLSGRRVSGDIRSLRPGIYIIGGRRCVVR